MGILDRIINRAVDNVTYHATRQIGDSIGNVVGEGIEEAGKGLTNNMKEKNQQKEIEMRQEALNAEIKLEETKKASELPPLCPHCKAPTSGKIICDYCGCKIVE